VRRIFSSPGEKNVLIGKADILFRYRLCSPSAGCGEWGPWNVWADKIEVRVDRLEGFELKLFRIFHDEKWLMADCKDFTGENRCQIKMWRIINHSMSWVVPFYMQARATENCFIVSGKPFVIPVADKEYVETEYSLIQPF